MKRALAASLTAAALLAAAPALADVVPGPPTDCPAGSQGDTCHGGAYCAPQICTTDADCQDAGACLPQAFCASTILCGGGWAPPDGGFPPTQRVEGLCEDGCDAGVTCSTLKVCTTRETPSSGSSSSGGNMNGGCSCDVVGGPAGAGAMLSALVAAVAALSTRRRRARTRGDA